MESALEIKNHEILGKAIQLKKAMTKEQSRVKLLDEQKRKLFLINLPKTATYGNLACLWFFSNKFFFEFFSLINSFGNYRNFWKLFLEEVHGYFSKFGEVEDTRVIHEQKKKNKTKNFGFVLFKGIKGMENVLAEGEIHILAGVEVECKPTLLKEELKQIQQKNAEMLKEQNLEKKRKKRREKKKRRKERKKQERLKKMEEEKAISQQAVIQGPQPQIALGPNLQLQTIHPVTGPLNGHLIYPQQHPFLQNGQYPQQAFIAQNVQILPNQPFFPPQQQQTPNGQYHPPNIQTVPSVTSQVIFKNPNVQNIRKSKKSDKSQRGKLMSSNMSIQSGNSHGSSTLFQKASGSGWSFAGSKNNEQLKKLNNPFKAEIEKQERANAENHQKAKMMGQRIYQSSFEPSLTRQQIPIGNQYFQVDQSGGKFRSNFVRPTYMAGQPGQEKYMSPFDYDGINQVLPPTPFHVQDEVELQDDRNDGSRLLIAGVDLGQFEFNNIETNSRPRDQGPDIRAEQSDKLRNQEREDKVRVQEQWAAQKAQ